MPIRALLCVAAVALGACRSASLSPTAPPDARTHAADPDCAQVVELRPAFFADGSASLDGARATLDENAAVLLRCPAVTVRVFGYAGDSEPDVMTLSQARADAVRAAYLSRGVAADRVTDASGRGVAPQARVGTDTAPRPAGPDRRADTVPSAR